MIIELSEEVKENYLNLKDKIILSEKKTGDKIDKLDSFDDTLKGNGDPGVWETIRVIKIWVWIVGSAVSVILILSLGGNWRGVTFETIKEKIFGKQTVVTPYDKIEEIIEIEETPKIENKQEN